VKERKGKLSRGTCFLITVEEHSKSEGRAYWIDTIDWGTGGSYKLSPAK